MNNNFLNIRKLNLVTQLKNLLPLMPNHSMHKSKKSLQTIGVLKIFTPSFFMLIAEYLWNINKEPKTINTPPSNLIQNRSGLHNNINERSKEEIVNVLLTWICIEVLSPRSYKEPQDLAGGDFKMLSMLDKDLVPWETKSKSLSKNKKLFYQVILGGIDLTKSINRLLFKYKNNGDKDIIYLAEETPIASIVVDDKGYVVSETSISSFAWGMPEALKENLNNLSDWKIFKDEFTQEIDRYLSKLITDSDGNRIPLSKSIIDSLYTKLIEILDIPLDLAIPRSFAIANYIHRNASAPTPLVLNSFFLDSLINTLILVKRDEVNSNILRYMGRIKPLQSYNILEEKHILVDILSPEKMSLSRWPTEISKNLVLLQQAVANLCANELHDSGILAINGPPGTGKTTLFRDIIADIIYKRAKVLASYDNPCDAFTKTTHKLQINNSALYLYAIDKKLTDHEIIIASSNNKAVENVSKVLPAIDSISGDMADNIKYFNCLSEKLIDCKSWGLISATLGNSTNLSAFKKIFWDDKDVGINTYLLEVSGTPQFFDIKDAQSEKSIGQKKPKIVIENDPPKSFEEALLRWKTVKHEFNLLCKNTTAKIKDLENIKISIDKLLKLQNTLETNQVLEELIISHTNLKPPTIQRVFNTSRYKLWEQELTRLLEWESLEKKLLAIRKKMGDVIVDKELFIKKTHEEIHKIIPWYDSEIQRLRNEVFISSIQLHKAFIDVAANPLRHNLGILMMSFTNKKNLAPLLLKVFPTLWASLFLIIPTISTTLASIESMFKLTPNNSLGWLFIDEASQATPQSAIGAILKTKRAIITGDPLQTEPVVAIPSALTEKICKIFKVDIKCFDPQSASVQTLAEEASPYYAELNTKHGVRKLGFPLLVHRRCADPMFSISNIIAYERTMVQAKTSSKSLIKTHLGDSRWFDIKDITYNKSKSSNKENNKAIELLLALQKSSIENPDVYIISPFREVVDSLKKSIKSNIALYNWLTQNNFNLEEKIGTIYTFQGREAEAVIIILGAQSNSNCGARKWASEFPNTLNVAVTRAKEAMYVIGNADLWKSCGVFEELYSRLSQE